METNDKRMLNKKSVSRGQPEWNENISDLSSMRLSEEERKRKINSRQSHNISIARAELIERSRKQGQLRHFSPTLSSNLRESRNKTIEEALVDGAEALALAHKIDENGAGYGQIDSLKKDYGAYLTSTANIKEQMAGEYDREEEISDEMPLVEPGAPNEPTHYPLTPQGWENLSNTIQLVVKTCEALWKQLEQERSNRQRLYLQLQEQRSVITTLTTELLQIQEHQEIILNEIHSSGRFDSDYNSESTPMGASQLSEPSSKYFPRSRRPAPPMTDPIASDAHSDTSLEARNSRKKHTFGIPGYSADEMALNRRYASPIPLRASHHAKSKSASQLNGDEENMIYNSGFLQSSSLIDSFKNYHISDK